MNILNEPDIRDIKERNVAFVSYVGNYMGNAEIFRGLFEKLFGWAFQKQVIGPDTVVLSAYYDDPNVTPPEKMRVEVCMTIPGSTGGEGDIGKKVLPGGKYAVMRTELTESEENGSAWEKLVEWVIQHNLTIDLSRASYEVYLNNPEEHPEKHHIVDICLAVSQ
jgi:AraC family transcriptional regulator